MSSKDCTDSDVKTLVSETFNCAVLDSGCTATVCGVDWLECFVNSLDSSSLNLVTESESNTWFKFGDGVRIQSMKKVNLPCEIAHKRIFINADVVPNDIPLLLGKSSMKKARMSLNLVDDTVSVFEKTIKLGCTSTGHYFLPLLSIQPETHANVLLTIDSNENKRKVTLKLHKQFAHPTAKRLKLLFKDAGIEDSEYDTLIEDISNNCEICLKYKRVPSRPVVSIPLARDFNEAVAMDLKEWDKIGNVWFLHLIDMATRFSVSTVIYSKEKQVIINNVVEKWIGTGLGCPKKFLSDNGGEFANEAFKDVAENLNITVLNTAAESPFSNGLCERNHAVIDEMVRKILADNPGCSLTIALSWAVHAKNSLQMVGGYSPYQLVFGRNPILPSVMVDELPALEGTTISETFAIHLNALHAGRQAFIKAESSERIRRALRHRVRESKEVVVNGDSVYYKREASNEWKGPGKVVGRDGKVVFVKHGNSIVRVHELRLTRTNYKLDDVNNETVSSHITPPLNKCDVMTPTYDTEDSDDESTNQQANMTLATLTLPRVGMKVNYLPAGDKIWREATVISRAGKSTGKYKNWFNLKENDESKSVDWESVQEWREMKDSLEADPSEVTISQNTTTGSREDAEVYIVENRHEEKRFREAKMKELENWKSFGVYDEVTDNGQPRITVRWVCNEKHLQDGSCMAKARLVARGFEESKPDNFKSDSPTVGKETLRIFLAILATNSWRCNSIDVKAAFLQGADFEREVYLKPPREASDMQGKLWMLKKCVYGLNDASRVWYFTVKDLLTKLGCTQLQVDSSMFYWYYEGELAGLFVMHVDDFIWGGTEEFVSNVINKIKENFELGNQENSMFKYIGLDITQFESSITLSQNMYLESVNTIPLASARSNNKDDPLTCDEIHEYRSLVGQLNWLCTQTRPDVCYDVLELSNSLKHPVVGDILKANKCVRKLRNERCVLRFSKLQSFSNLTLHVFSDASHANLPDGYSSAEGFVIFLADSSGACCPVAWSSKKIRRVVKSTLAAETLALLDAVDVCLYIKHIFCELLQNAAIDVKCHVDNRSLWDNVYSTKSAAEKRLRIDIASIKQMVETKEITGLFWINSEKQLSDCLTKRGACCSRLIRSLCNGCLFME